MHGCTERSCPCLMWVNCRQYEQIYNKKWRQQHYNSDRHIAIIDEWYRNNFKLRYEYPDGFGNG